eukprot:scaffold84257_cov63-Phaeocystis_antarctica.AAC.2
MHLHAQKQKAPRANQRKTQEAYCAEHPPALGPWRVIAASRPRTCGVLPSGARAVQKKKKPSKRKLSKMSTGCWKIARSQGNCASMRALGRNRLDVRTGVWALPARAAGGRGIW